MEMLGVMTDMDEKRKEKVNDFRVRLEKIMFAVEQMNEREQSVKPFDEMRSFKTLHELRSDAEELDKDLMLKLSAIFTLEG